MRLMRQSQQQTFLTRKYDILALLLGAWAVYQLVEHRRLSGKMRYDVGVTPTGTTRRNIFIDLGANCGNSYLLSKERGSLEATADNTPWDIYLWEANPTLVNLYLKDLPSSRRQQVGSDRVHVIGAAAATSDATMELFLTKDQDTATSKQDFRNSECDIHSKYNPSGGSSLMKSSKVAGKPVKVPAYDFGKWLQALNIRGHDKLIMKIDIEGAEVELLEHLLSNYPQDFCHVEKLMIEWHGFLFKDPELNEKHAEFQKSFRDRFQKACGKKPDLGAWH